MATERLQVILEMITGQYKAQAAQAATATQAVGTSAKTATTRTATMGSTMGKVSTGGLLAIAGGAIAAKGAFEGTVGAFASFDDKMNESLAIMGNVSEAMRKDMADAAREVATTTRFSADDAAESYFFLASAGLDAAASIEAMPAVAAFAQAGMFDMATATDLATDAQSALGLASDDAAVNLENLTRVTDVFVAANTLANTSVEQIAEAMTTRAGAALRALDKDIEEGAAALAVLADQGIKGAEAGTQLGIVLRDLQTKALSNADAFERAGISVFDASGNMRNIADVLSDVEDRMDGMSDAQKRAELSALGFSDRSIAVLTTMLGTSDAIREYEGELRRAGGTTAEVAENQLKSATAQWDLFKSGLADVGLEVGENVLPALLDMLPALEDMATDVGEVVVQLSEMAAVGQPVLSFLSEMNALLAGRPSFGLDENFFGFSIGDDVFDPGKLAGDFLKGPIGLYQNMTEEFDEFMRLIDNSPTRIRGFSTGLENHNEVVTLATTGYGQMGDNVGSADQAMLNMARRTAPQVVEGMGEVKTAVNNTAGPLGGLIGQLLEAQSAAESVFNELRSASDPVFAAVDAWGAYVAALQAADEENAGVQEDLDVLEAKIDLRSALENLGSNYEDAMQALSLATDTPIAQLEAMLALIEGFDGQTFKATFESEFRSTGDTSHLIGDPDVFSNQPQVRQHGGPVTAGRPYIVGEAGPEMIVPGANGQVISNADMRALVGGSRGGDFTVTFERTDPHTDAQLVGHLRSVQRLMETI